MSATIDPYFLNTPRTEAYKVIKNCEVEIGGGLTIPLQDIVEEEVKARVKWIYEKETRIRTAKRRNKRKMREDSMRIRPRYIKENPSDMEV